MKKRWFLIRSSFTWKHEEHCFRKVVLKEGWSVMGLDFHQGFHHTSKIHKDIKKQFFITLIVSMVCVCCES